MCFQLLLFSEKLNCVPKFFEKINYVPKWNLNLKLKYFIISLKITIIKIIIRSFKI